MIEAPESLREWLVGEWDREPEARHEFHAPHVMARAVPDGLRVPGFEQEVARLCAWVLNVTAPDCLGGRTDERDA